MMVVLVLCFYEIAAAGQMSTSLGRGKKKSEYPPFNKLNYTTAQNDDV